MRSMKSEHPVQASARQMEVPERRKAGMESSEMNLMSAGRCQLCDVHFFENCSVTCSGSPAALAGLQQPPIRYDWLHSSSLSAARHTSVRSGGKLVALRVCYLRLDRGFTPRRNRRFACRVSNQARNANTVLGGSSHRSHPCRPFAAEAAAIHLRLAHRRRRTDPRPSRAPNPRRSPPTVERRRCRLPAGYRSAHATIYSTTTMPPIGRLTGARPRRQRRRRQSDRYSYRSSAITAIADLVRARAEGGTPTTC